MFSYWEAFCTTSGELQLLLNSCLSKLPVKVQPLLLCKFEAQNWQAELHLAWFAVLTLQMDSF